MADTKVSALTELAAAPATGDEIYIRDISEAASAESKRITVANLIRTLFNDLDCNNNSLLNVGASTNDWTATQLVHSGSGSSLFTQTGSGTNAQLSGVEFRAETSDDAADGFGSTIAFQFTDTGVTGQAMGFIGYERNGADDTSRFVIDIQDGGLITKPSSLQLPVS